MTGWAVPGFVHVRQMRIDAVGRRVVARHRISRRVVSITYLSQEFLADAEFRNRFVIESEQLAKVWDASVARVHRYVEYRDSAAVIADHVDGTPLRALLLEEGALGTEAAVVVLKDALHGLAAGHAAGLAHGDLKPEDVVLTRAGRVRLVDFGLSTSGGRRLLARSTPFYLAPERWSGGPATEPGDLYAATVTFFECLVGAPPFHADSPAALCALHERSAPPLGAVPGSVRELVRYGLAKDPARRPSVLGFLAHVEEAAAVSLGDGWEGRGRRELSRLLARPTHPGDLPVAPVPRAGQGRERHVRLAAVLGGALVLAAGLSSPPLPGVRLPGSDGLAEPHEKPPVLALPASPNGTAGVWVSGKTTEPFAPAPPAGPVGPEIATSPRRIPVDQGLSQPSMPATIPLTPQTTPPPVAVPAPPDAVPAPQVAVPAPPNAAPPPPTPPPLSGEPPAPEESAVPTPAEPEPVEPTTPLEEQEPTPPVVQVSQPDPESVSTQHQRSTDQSGSTDIDAADRTKCGADADSDDAGARRP